MCWLFSPRARRTRVNHALGRAEDERGAVLVLFALMLVGIVTMVAIVIDLGHLRDTRRSNQTVADFAALAAARALADGGASPQIAACETAWKYVKTNTPDLPSSASMPCSTLPDCTVSSLNEQTIEASNTGAYTIRITYGVSNLLITDPNVGAVFESDGTQCERMMIRVQRTDDTFFAGIIGVDEQSTESRAVGRGFGKADSEKVAALLLLERTDCGVLTTSGQGNVLVKKFSDEHPGIIHSDSLATTNCSGTTSSNYVVYGTAVPNGNPRAGQPSIMTEGTNAPCPGTGTPGTLSGMLDLKAAGSVHDAAVVPPAVGVCPAPTEGKIVSRRPIDERYNKSPDNKRISNLRTSSDGLLAKSNAELQAMGYTLFTDCGGTGVITAAKVVIDCGTGALSPGNAGALEFTGTDFVVKGRIDVGSGRVLRFNNAKTIHVRGCTGTCTGSTPADRGINVQGTFAVNVGVPAATSCTAREKEDGVTNITVLTVKGGGFDSNGANAVVRMCQTFLYMSGPTSPQQTESGGTCSTSAPCPLSNSATGWVRIHNQTVDWSAPDQLSVPADDANPYEDLALWTEAGGSTAFDNNSEIGGSGTTVTTGVFFMPNAKFKFSGNTAISQDFNAQFVARKMELAGQGALNMKPNPEDAVPTLTPSFSLIR